MTADNTTSDEITPEPEVSPETEAPPEVASPPDLSVSVGDVAETRESMG